MSGIGTLRVIERLHGCSPQTVLCSGCIGRRASSHNLRRSSLGSRPMKEGYKLLTLGPDIIIGNKQLCILDRLNLGAIT